LGLLEVTEMSRRMRLMNTYSFKQSYDVSKLGVDRVVDLLSLIDDTVDIINVENDKSFQEFDIDLVHVTNRDVVNIEVKADTYESENFFFETVSNATKGTHGCFMYTRADYLYYYFIKSNKLYVLPVASTREWFLKNINRFPKKELATKENSRILYHSYGYTVPIKVVMREVYGVKEVDVEYELEKALKRKIVG
jgi:hypothetical protein